MKRVPEPTNLRPGTTPRAPRANLRGPSPGEDAGDLEIINAHAAELNKEAEDVLGYQAIPMNRDDLRPRAQEVTVTDEALVVDLLDGRTLIIPLTWFPRLSHGTAAERANFETSGDGSFIRWPDLDEDLNVAGLLAGRRSGESPRSLKNWLKVRAARTRR